MQAEQVKNILKSEFSDNLYKNYHWFYENFFLQIDEASKEFLNYDIGLKLISVGEKDNVLFAGEDYFVTKVRITKDLCVLIRISKIAIESILNDVLGESSSGFSLETITELEAKILTAFNDFIYKKFSNSLLDLNTFSKKHNNPNDCHLTFFVRTRKEDLGKIIISVPISALPEMPVREEIYTFDIEDFPKTNVVVDLRVGKTRIALNDLKNIEAGDIVVLEKSNINKMALKTNEGYRSFKLSPNPALIVRVDDGELDSGGGVMEENITKSGNMWDSIQVDISAEFEKVKIPLGDLRQISEGLVVDIGSVYENKIDLMVENKVIASGELVIINDRYGVRVDKIVDHKSAGASSVEPAQKAGKVSESAPVNEDFNEDDFDYSNFEIEDDEI